MYLALFQELKGAAGMADWRGICPNRAGPRDTGPHQPHVKQTINQSINQYIHIYSPHRSRFAKALGHTKRREPALWSSTPSARRWISTSSSKWWTSNDACNSPASTSSSTRPLPPATAGGAPLGEWTGSTSRPNDSCDSTAAAARDWEARLDRILFQRKVTDVTTSGLPVRARLSNGGAFVHRVRR